MTMTKPIQDRVAKWSSTAFGGGFNLGESGLLEQMGHIKKIKINIIESLKKFSQNLNQVL